MTIHWVPYFDGRKLHRECLDMAKELTKTGQFYKVRVGHGRMVNGRRLSKVFVLVKKGVEI